MKKQVIISSKNPEIMVAANALRLRNSILDMGFKTRSVVVDLIVEHYPKYATSKGINRLQNWWNGRVNDKTINNDIEMVINKLKHE